MPFITVSNIKKEKAPLKSAVSEPAASYSWRWRTTASAMDAEALAHIFEKHIRDTKSNGVGVSNVNERIRLFYGPEYGLHFESEPGQGTRAIVVIPAGKDVTAVENE